MSGPSKFHVRCPDCGSALAIDRATGEILHHEPAARRKAGGKDFDRLLAGLGEARSRADEIFDREVSAYQDRERLMDEKFQEALRRAEENPDERPPPRPWELD